MNTSPKSRLAALLFCWFFGLFDAHRFYVGEIGTGLLQLLTLGGFFIWAIVDLIMIVAGSFRDKQGNRITRWGD